MRTYACIKEYHKWWEYNGAETNYCAQFNMQIRADFLSHKLPNYLQLVKLIKGNSYLSNEAPRGKAARYLRNSSKPPILLRPAYAEASAGKQCFAGFSSPLLLCEVASLRSTGIPASPAAGYSAKENNEFQQHDSDFTFVRIGDENTMPSTGADHGPVGSGRLFKIPGGIGP